jgi:hypothetical protein
VNQSNQWVFGSQVTLGVETGLGSGIYDTLPTGDYELEDGAGSYELESGTGVLELQDVNEVVEDPNLIELSFSTDGGHTYSEPDPVSLGVLGDYTRQVTWYKTPGRFYDLVLRAATTANRPTRIFSCEIRADQGTGMR